MSFNTIAQCSRDAVFGARTAAAYAAEGITRADLAWQTMHWAIASDPSVAGPYESAVLNNNPNPGGDESVVTDGMLTAAVQAHPFTEPAT
jgi:hypothetical protein